MCTLGLRARNGDASILGADPDEHDHEADYQNHGAEPRHWREVVIVQHQCAEGRPCAEADCLDTSHGDHDPAMRVRFSTQTRQKGLGKIPGEIEENAGHDQRARDNVTAQQVEACQRDETTHDQWPDARAPRRQQDRNQ